MHIDMIDRILLIKYALKEIKESVVACCNVEQDHINVLTKLYENFLAMPTDENYACIKDFAAESFQLLYGEKL